MTTSAAPDVYDLIGDMRRSWLEECRRALRDQPASLAHLLAADSAYTHEFQRGVARPIGADVHVAESSETAHLQTARAILAVTRALAEPDDAETILDEAVAHWNSWRAMTPADGAAGAPVAVPAPSALHTVATRLYLRGGPAAGYSTLVAMAVAGGLPRELAKVSVATLFDRGGDGGSGLLTLTLHEGGPAGLYPHPERMAFFAGDEHFQQALGRAWSSAPETLRGRCVLWSLTDQGRPCLNVEHGSLGLAFAVVLAELARRQGSLKRVRMRRIGPRYAFTGRLGVDGRIEAVTGHERKLAAAARERLTVIAPAASQRAFDDDPRPSSVKIVYVRTLDEAIELSRRWNPTVLISVFLAVALMVGLGSGIGLVISADRAARAAAERRSIAAGLVTRAVTYEQSDPRLAALLALAAYRVDPTAKATDAMLRISQRNQMIAMRIAAHVGGITALTQDHTARYVFSAGDDHTLRAFDVATGRQLSVLNRLRTIGAMAHSPVTALMVTVDDDNGIQLWRTDEPTRLTEPARLERGAAPDVSDIQGCGFYGEGQRLYCISEQGTAWTWDAISHDLLGHDRIVDATVSVLSPTAPDDYTHVGSSIALAVTEAGGQRVLSYDLATGERTDILTPGRLSGRRVTSLGIQPGHNGEIIAVGTDTGLMIWNISTGSTVAYPAGGITARVNDLQFTGSTLAVTTARGTYLVRAGSAATDDEYGLIGDEPVGGSLDFIATNPSTSTIAAAAQDGSIVLLDPLHRRIGQPPAPGSTSIAFDAGGELLLARGNAGRNRSTTLETIRPGDGPQAAEYLGVEPRYAVHRQFDVPQQWGRGSGTLYVNSSDITDDWVAVGGQDDTGGGFVAVWDARTQRPLRFLEFSEPGGDHDLVNGILIAPRHRLVLARHVSGAIAAWSLDTGAELYRMQLDSGDGGDLDLSGDGDTAVAAVAVDAVVDTAGARPAGKIYLIDLASGRLTTVPVMQPVYRAVYAPGGTGIAAAGTDSTLRWYDAAGRVRPGDPVRTDAAVVTMAYRPDGSQLAVGFLNGEVHIYDVASRVLAIPPLVADGELVVQVAWEPSGGLLAASTGAMPQGEEVDRPNRVNLWRIADQSWTRQMCSLAGRDITPAEWAEHVGPRPVYGALCTGAP